PHIPRQLSFWFVKVIPKGFRTGMIWLNLAWPLLRQTQKLPAAHAGTILLPGLGPNTRKVAMMPKPAILCVKYISRPKFWIQVHVVQPRLLLNAVSEMSC